MIVMKFGGSSLESAEAVRRVVGIVAARAERRPLIVVSALGKTTDQLLAIAEAAVTGHSQAAAILLSELRDHTSRMAAELASDDAHDDLAGLLDENFEELASLIKGLEVLGELTPRSVGAVSSFGERIASRVFAEALRAAGLDAAHVDAREVVVTDDRHTEAQPLAEPTNRRANELLRPLIEKERIPVLGGFIASNEKGVTTTLGRGGSDLSASLLGAALDAEEVQIWTDVDGVLTADPSIVADAHRLRVLSFAEASELAYFGARVLHPATMAPALEKNIPVKVLNSRRPEIEGTRIVAEPAPSQVLVKSIAYKENITVVDIRSTRMLMAHGFLARIFQIFEEHETAVDMVSTSEVSVSLTVDRAERLGAISARLSEFSTVTLREQQAIVCVVGEGIRYTPGIAAKVFSALDGIPVSMISLGAERLNVGFVVNEKDLEAVVTRLHAAFFSEIDHDVFA